MDNPTSDEKVFAAFAHATVMFSFLGPIGPLLIWNSQRARSKYVRFHALQAMGYQAFVFWAWFLSIFVVFFGAVVVIAALSSVMERSSSNMNILPFLLQPVIFIGIFGLWGILFLLGIAGVICCMTDRKFRYPIIGGWLEKKLFDDQTNEDHFEEWEDNWISGVCHSTAILQIWGIVTPLIVWFTQKERSARLRFQALQAVFYQLIAFIAQILFSVVGGLIYFLFILGLLTFGFTSKGIENGTSIPPAFGILLILFFCGCMLVWAVSLLVIPIYYFLAATASIRTIRGQEYQYPILGKILARRLKISGTNGKIPNE